VRDVGVPSCSPHVTRYLTYSPLKTVFRSQASPCEVSGGHGNIKTSIFPSTLAVPCQCHSTNAPYSLIRSFITDDVLSSRLSALLNEMLTCVFVSGSMEVRLLLLAVKLPMSGICP